MSTDAAQLPPNPALNPPPFIYKLAPVDEWNAQYVATGHYTGSPVDIQDGFIHISSKEDTPRTVELYYSDKKNIVLIQLKTDVLLKTGQLKFDWVQSRKSYFPHYYDMVNGFTKEHVAKVTPIVYDEVNKRHILPELE